MFHKFLKYISQSISGMIGVSVYILADTFFISYKCGADGLAALNLILPVFGLVFAIGSMIGIGSATRYNISTAQGSPSDYYFTQSIFWCLICSIPFMLTGIFIPHKALALLGADAGLIRLGRNYIRIVLLFTPFFMSNYTFTAFARNDHATSIAMIGSISGSFFNILFDYIFMFPLNLGFLGAALGNRSFTGCDDAGMFDTLSWKDKPCRVSLAQALSSPDHRMLPAWCFCIFC